MNCTNSINLIHLSLLTQPMAIERKSIEQIQVRDVDKGEDSMDAFVAVYRMGDEVSLLITTRRGGDAEVILTCEQAQRLAKAIQIACDTDS